MPPRKKTRGGRVVFEGDSAHQHIIVVDSDDMRHLYFGSSRMGSQTSVFIGDEAAGRDEDLVAEYSGMMLVGLALTPKNREILLIGLGGGYTPLIFQKHLPDHHLTVVELDPMVAEIAGKYFGFAPGGNVDLVLGEGGEFVEGCRDGSWDQIWVDAYSHSRQPKQFTTLKFLNLMRRKLSEGGVAAQNLDRQGHRHYDNQIIKTRKAFGAPPMILGAFHYHNNILFSLNSETRRLPEDEAGLLKLVRSYPDRVGPWSLSQQAKKIIPLSSSSEVARPWVSSFASGTRH
ncbi:MAG: hypothetical protein LBP95_05600 [Deltaproteobacteria bacterium]|jgi:spermidine synthase|nr:hypothetical protein [Deltaproteobacteria bacterium]